MRSARWLAISALGTATACTLLQPDLDALYAGGEAVEGGAPEGGSDATSPSLDGGADVLVPGVDAEAGSAYAAEVLADAPVVYMRLGEASGDVAKNERPSGDGKYAGETAMLGAPGLLFGDRDTSVRLQGRGRISLPLVPALFVGQSPFTIEAWIAVDPVDGGLFTQWIVGREDVTNPRFGVSLIVDESGVALERWQNQNASRCTGASPRLGAPSHVVSTFDGAQMRVWVDGIPTGPVASPQNVADQTLPIVAGAQAGQAAAFFQGRIDEVALYDRVLSPDRILAHYQAGRAP